MPEKTNVTRELAKLQKTVASLREEVAVLSQEVSKEDKTKSLTTRIRLFLRNLLGLVADASALLIPAATIYLAFSNFVSVPPTHSLQLNDPLTIPFIVQNNSYINLRDLKVVVQLVNVNGDADSVKNITFTNVGIINDFLPTMESNSSHTLLFQLVKIIAPKLTKITQADIQIHISYKALFFTKEFKQKFRFIALPGKEGFYEYYPIQSKL